MTSIHPINCESYREEFLEALGSTVDAYGVWAGESEHAESCDSCKDWRADTLVVKGVLGSMNRLVAPAPLEALLAEDLQLGSGAFQSALRGLEFQVAPAELDSRLALEIAQIANEAPLPKWVELLENLPRLVAPKVLDRLLSEEISDSEKAITGRFVGGLFRRRSPETLDSRLQASLGSESVAPRLRLLKWGTAAAAAIMVWVSVPAYQAGATPKFHFEIVEVANLEDLSPFARSLASDLAGGMLYSMQMAPKVDRQEGGGL
jgi:hypothetical protein